MWIPRAIEPHLIRSASTRPVIVLTGARQTGKTWRDRTREVDFVVDAGGRAELFEAKWTELPDIGDTVNLAFVRSAMGASSVVGGAVVSRTPNSFPFANGFRAVPVTDLG